MQLRVRGGVLGDLKQRLKDVVKHLLEVLYHSRLLVDVVQTGYLRAGAWGTLTGWEKSVQIPLPLA